jgi:hypothetical protein
MKILEIVRHLRDGHYVEFGRAAIHDPALVFALWQLLCKESQITVGALDALLIRNVGVPVHCFDPALEPTIRTLLVPERGQGSVFGEKGSSLWTQATAELKTCTMEAQKRSSKSAASARDLLQLLLKGELPFERARERISEDKMDELVARALLARAGTPVQTVALGEDRIELGGGEALSPWQSVPGVCTLTNAQVLSPTRNGLAVRVLRDADDLPQDEKARDIEILLGPGTCLRARVQLALATAVPVQITVQIEESIAGAKRRYTLDDIALPADIREAIEQLVRQAELF